MVLAGKEYGSGSSRDWAAKGTALLGVRAVIAESYERIHRSNLIGMGVLPLQYAEGQNASSLGLTGHEIFTITGLDSLNEGVAPKTVGVRAEDGDRLVEFEARLRIDTPMEAEYYRTAGSCPTCCARWPADPTAGRPACRPGADRPGLIGGPAAGRTRR